MHIYTLYNIYEYQFCFCYSLICYLYRLIRVHISNLNTAHFQRDDKVHNKKKILNAKVFILHILYCYVYISVFILTQINNQNIQISYIRIGFDGNAIIKCPVHGRNALRRAAAGELLVAHIYSYVYYHKSRITHVHKFSIFYKQTYL